MIRTASALAAALALPALAQTVSTPFVNPATGDRFYLSSPVSYPVAAGFAASRGGKLAVIQNAETNEWIRSTVAAASGNAQPCYIGLSDAVAEGVYVWSGGERAVYFNWDAGQPDDPGGEDYTVMNPATGRWSDVNFLGVHPAIIQVSGDIRVPEEFPTIQSAIDVAVDGQTIVVAPGTYNELIDFGYKKLTVRSAQGPFMTTIVAIRRDYGVVMAGGQGPETVLEGFTILPAPGLTDVVAVVGDGQVIRNCRITNPSGIAVQMWGTGVVSDSLIVDSYIAIDAFSLGLRLDAVVQNCTIAGNRHALVAQSNGFNVPATLRLVNSATAGNVALSVVDGAANILYFSNVLAEAFINGNNLNADPRFVHAPGPNGRYNVTDDYRLRPDSPCIDAGNNIRRRPLSFIAAPTDVAGQPRFADIPSVLDIGGGPGPVVDVGAHEFSPEDSCRIDFNHDGFVDFFDYDDFVAAFEAGC